MDIVFRAGGTEIVAAGDDLSGDLRILRPACDRAGNYAEVPAEAVLAFVAGWLRDQCADPGRPMAPAARRFLARMAGQPVPFPAGAA